MKILLVLIGGAIGALARYALAGFVHKYFETVFPYGTLVVNLLGSLIIGILWAFWFNMNISPELRIFLFIGILGSFTTFSTYTLETLNLILDAEYWNALLNIFFHNVCGLLSVFIGFVATKQLIEYFKF